MVQVLDKEGDANMLTLERAKEINAQMVTEEHLIRHSTNVMAAMGAMARHFGEDEEHWKAIGYLHDYDYEKYPEEHLQHTEQPLLEAGLTQEEVRAILRRPHGITDLNTKSFMKKFKDKRFAAKCDRELIKKGCEMLGMEVKEVAEICIEGMRPYAEEIGLLGTES